jgi:glucose/arabinose dehydrogenase
MGSLQNIFFQALLISLQLFIPYSTAQSSCSSSISPSYPAPSAASGYKVSIIANGFSSPRSIIFDSAGHLLVVEAKKGITAVTFNDNGGSCLSVKSKTTVISDTTVRSYSRL